MVPHAWTDAERNTLDAIDTCICEVKNLAASVSSEVCHRCDFDHEHESMQAQLIHSLCPICKAELILDKIGEGPDHRCIEEIGKKHTSSLM